MVVQMEATVEEKHQVARVVEKMEGAMKVA